MIEWKPYGQTRETQPPSHKNYLVTNGRFLSVGEHFYCGSGVGYQLVSVQGNMIPDVTHYAEINLPK